MRKQLCTLIVALFLPALALADNGLAKTIQTLQEIDRGQRGCHPLHMTWTEEDGLGGSLTLAIHQGRAVVTESRIGLPEIQRTGTVSIPTCRKLAHIALTGELWKLSKVKPRKLLTTSLRMGALNGSAFKVHVNRDETPRVLKELREVVTTVVSDIAKK